MSLLDTASLILTPNGYKADKLYSVKPTNGDGDMVVTRNTTATRVNSSGLIESVAFNAPRIDYTNASCPSILVEPLRTNDALQSDGNVSTYSTAINTTNASSSFNSFANAIQFPSTALALAYKAIITTAQTYTISVFIKMDDNSVPILGSNSTTGNVSLVIGGNIATSNLKVENYGNNVYRLSGTATSTGVNVNNGVVRFDTQVLKSFKTTGIQLEAGSTATSYIPTTTIPITRNADVITKTGITNLIGQTNGTIFVEANLTANTAERRIITVSNGTELQRIIFWTLGTTLYVSFNAVGITVGAFPIGTAKIALGYTIAGGSTTYSIKLNNNILITGTAAAAPTPLSAIYLGNNSTSGLQLNDRIESATLFLTRLTDPQLANLTAI